MGKKTGPATGPRAPKRPAPRREDSRAIVDAIVGAAMELPTDAPIQRIAERAGVGVASFYRYFPDRVALHAELARRVHEQVVATVAQVMGLDSLEAMARASVEIVLEGRYASADVIRTTYGALPFTWHDEQASARHGEITSMMAQTLGRFVEATEEECTRRARLAFALVTGISRTRALYGDVLPHDEAAVEVLARAVLVVLETGLVRKPEPDEPL